METANPTQLHPLCLGGPGKTGMNSLGHYFSWCCCQKQHSPGLTPLLFQPGIQGHTSGFANNFEIGGLYPLETF